MSKIDNRHIRQISCRRIVWIAYVKLCTILLPDVLLSHLSIKTKVRRDAFREKLTLCFTYLSISALFCFWLEYITFLFCDPPKLYYFKNVYSNHSQFSSINGQVVDWTDMGNSTTMTQQVNLYPHLDLSPMFPLFMQLKRSDNQLTYNNQIINDCITDFNQSSQADNWLNYLLDVHPGYLYQENQLISCPIPYQLNETGAACFYTQQDIQEYQRYHKKGSLEFSLETIAENFSTLPYATNQGQALVVIDNLVLDITNYLIGATNIVQVSQGTYSRSFAVDRMFLPLDLTIMLFLNLGKDISLEFHQIPYAETYKACLLELFFHGVIDGGQDKGCSQVNLALWITLGCFWLYLLIKISLACFSRLKISNISQPLTFLPPHLLFFIPCFAESCDLVRQTFDSLARCNYPDDRKLLFLVCDGLVKNKSDSKFTYQAILESLGYSSSKDPEPRAYISLGQGSRRLNYAKVYTGFYESGSNRVPFLMVVKVGKVAELSSVTQIPGNRGKRDSMMIILGFLERCMNLAHNRITPLEFEIFNQCYNFLGIDPREFKYMLATDADTQVQDDAVIRLVSRLEADPKLSAISGHIKPANPEENIITILQIFPSYMTFFSGLAYEACLGRVTTLNGGFVLYRLWTKDQDTNVARPKISDEILDSDSIRSIRIDPGSSSDDNVTTTTSNTTVVTTLRNKALQRRRLHKQKKRDAALHHMKLCCIHPTVLRIFAAAQPITMHMENLLLLGEEQYFSLVLIRSIPEYHMTFEPEAIAYSTMPTHFFALQALETRNLRVVFHNLLEFQAISRHFGIRYAIVSFIKLMDMIFTTPLTIYLYSIFIRYFIFKTMVYAIIVGSFAVLMVLYIFYFVTQRQFKYVIWFCIYCLFSVPIFHVYFPILAAWYSDYANRWFDVYPIQKNKYSSRLHGIVDDNTAIEEEQVERMRFTDFEILEAEKAAMREKEQAEMLDAKFSGFTGYVRGHANKPSWSSSRTRNSLISAPASVQLKEGHGRAGHSRFASEEDARRLLSTRSSVINSSHEPFLVDDPFDDLQNDKTTLSHNRSHSQSHSLSYPNLINDDTISSTIDYPPSVYPSMHRVSIDSIENNSAVSLNLSLVDSNISLEQETTNEQHRTLRGLRPTRQITQEQENEGRNTPIHSKLGSK